ncbi:MAG TPA: TIR domain-containing protein [Bryobacteraceae bacterium]
MSFYRATPSSPPHLRKLFISHDWEYTSHYDGVIRLLNSIPEFKWKNLSVPRSSPVTMSDLLPRSHRTIVHFLDERMRQADCAIILAGVYATNSGWIQSEIEAAQEYGVPIIGIRPQGQERISAIVQDAAGNNMVNWNARSLIDAILRPTSPLRRAAHLAASRVAASNVGQLAYGVEPPKKRFRFI